MCQSNARPGLSIDVTVKHRIGVDNQDSYQALCDFIGEVANAGCQTFIVHARKAWLQGLSPKENRDIPPLSYDTVYRLKLDFPELEIIINGGVTSLEQAQHHLHRVDGVMIGREAYQNPWLLSQADELIFGADGSSKSRHHIIDEFLPYVEAELSAGTPLNRITRHILGLYQGEPGTKKWRRMLSEEAHKPGAGSSLITRAAAQITSSKLGFSSESQR